MVECQYDILQYNRSEKHREREEEREHTYMCNTIIILSVSLPYDKKNRNMYTYYFCLESV